MPFAAALSEHPLAAQAAGEVIGQVVEQVGEAPDLAVLFASAAHTGVMDDVTAAVENLLEPAALVGCTAVSVVGGPREVEERPALALWAARGVATTPVRLTLERGAEGPTVAGWPTAGGRDARALLLLADPFSFPAEEFLEGLSDQVRPDLPVVGGLASAARGPGGNRLVLDGRLYTDGAVGVLLEGAVDVASVVSQGCRPIGQPFTVTRAEGPVIYELAGRPALERVQEVVERLSPNEQALVRHGIHLGRVIHEQRDTFDRGDFLIRNVMGADREAGAIAVGDTVDIGSTVQFQVRDAGSADEDLRILLDGRAADGALLFTCNGRGLNLFPGPDHDASVVDQTLDHAPLAGMFCAGEIGPVGGRNFLHGFTASVVLFRDR